MYQNPEFKRHVAELKGVGLTPEMALLGAAIIIRLDLLLDKTTAVQEALKKLVK